MTSSRDDSSAMLDESEFDNTQWGRTHMSRSAIITASALGAVLVGVIVWLGVAQAQQDARWQPVGFDIVSSTEAVATFDVYLYSDADVTCYVHALNAKFAEVGVASIAVHREQGSEQRHDVTVTTAEPAVTAVVDYCIAVTP